MQGEKVNGRVATWVAGVVGVWSGLAALGALVAALMSPHWALVREPMVLAESPSQDTWSRGYDSPPLRQESFQPVVTTITFRLGLWTACPHINTSALHFLVASPPCSSVSYAWRRISHRDLHLPAPAPLLQTVMARMRMSTPFLVGACGLLAGACVLSLLSRCCFAHAALLAALLYSLGGLSVGVGVVWFVSVVSEEYGIASGRRTSWATMYAYRYGWSLMAAGSSGVAALLAALLTGHAHLARHAPMVGGMRPRSSSSTEESLARPLLRCRSEGCLGQRSFTSDTIRTYLTCDSRRHHPRGCLPPPPPPIHHCPSIVDLTRPQEDHHPSAPPDSRRSSRATILGEEVVRDHHLHLQQQGQQQQQGQGQGQQQQGQGQQPAPQQGQQQQQGQQGQQQGQQQGRGWPVETSRVIIETPRGAVTPVVPPPPPLSSSSSSNSPLEPPPPLPVSGRGSGAARRAAAAAGGGGGEGGTGSSRPACDPLRLPEYNSFTSGNYSRTLPTEGRQMAVFERRSGGQRSATLTRSTTKISSEV